MTLTITYSPDHIRTYANLTQPDVNRIITYVSKLSDGTLPIKITLTD